jgi:hypothetical protein
MMNYKIIGDSSGFYEKNIERLLQRFNVYHTTRENTKLKTSIDRYYLTIKQDVTYKKLPDVVKGAFSDNILLQSNPEGQHVFTFYPAFNKQNFPFDTKYLAAALFALITNFSAQRNRSFGKILEFDAYINNFNDFYKKLAGFKFKVDPDYIMNLQVSTAFAPDSFLDSLDQALFSETQAQAYNSHELILLTCNDWFDHNQPRSMTKEYFSESILQATQRVPFAVEGTVPFLNLAKFFDSVITIEEQDQSSQLRWPIK